MMLKTLFTLIGLASAQHVVPESRRIHLMRDNSPLVRVVDGWAKPAPAYLRRDSNQLMSRQRMTQYKNVHRPNHQVHGVGGSQSLGATSGKRDLYFYMDNWNGMTASEMGTDMATMYARGLTHLMFAFYCAASGQPLGPFDTVLAWQGFSSSDKSSLIAAKNAAGAKFVMSMGGGTDASWYSMDANTYSNQACTFAVQQQFDGVDFDMENQDPNDRNALDWLVTATKNCGSKGAKFISHAPQAPFLSTANYGEAYLYVLKNSNNLVNKFLIQYYNQGAYAPYTTYDQIFTRDTAWGASISELRTAAPGFDDVFVVGKILLPEDGGDGYVNTQSLNQMVCQAEKEIGYNAGLMFWQHSIGRSGETDAVYSGLSTSCAGGSTPVGPTPTPVNPTAPAYPTQPTVPAYPTQPTAPAYPTQPTARPTQAPPAPPAPSSGCYAPSSWDWQAANCIACPNAQAGQCATNNWTTCYPSMSACCQACVGQGYCTGQNCPF